MTPRDIPANGLTFTVDVYGDPDAAPVLMLHGFGVNRTMWAPLGEALAQEGRFALAPDQRGYSPGARPPERGAYATERLIEDALALMEGAAGDRPFHLVGHDWGGQLAWLIAAHQPARVRTLTVVSRPHPAAFVRAMREDPTQAGRSGHHRRFQSDEAVAQMRADQLADLQARLVQQQVPPERARAYAAALLEPGAIEGAVNWYRGGSGFELASTPPIDAPTLYLWGTADDTVGRAAAELTGAYVTGPYRFEALPEGGHFLVDQFSEGATRLILDHIARY